jgi:hypothetical protein
VSAVDSRRLSEFEGRTDEPQIIALKQVDHGDESRLPTDVQHSQGCLTVILLDAAESVLGPLFGIEARVVDTL